MLTSIDLPVVSLWLSRGICRACRERSTDCVAVVEKTTVLISEGSAVVASRNLLWLSREIYRLCGCGCLEKTTVLASE